MKLSDIKTRIRSIKKQLGITDNTKDIILIDLYERYLTSAKKICLREDEPPSMLNIVHEIVCGAYNQRGGEGFSSSAVGGQSYSNIDLYVSMQKKLIDAGLRIARL